MRARMHRAVRPLHLFLFALRIDPPLSCSSNTSNAFVQVFHIPYKYDRLENDEKILVPVDQLYVIDVA